MPPTWPSFSRPPATRGVRHNFCCGTDSSTSTAMNNQAALVNSSREDEDAATTRFKDGRTPSPGTPEVVSGSEDKPTRDSGCLDAANGYHNVTDSNEAMCRICREGNQKVELVSPCSCSGTIGFVHVSCIEHWLNERNVDFCELCGHRFQMAAQPITTLLFWRWVWRNKRWLWRSLRGELLLSVVAIPAVVLVWAVLASLQAYEMGDPWVVGYICFASVGFLVASLGLALNSVYTRYRLSVVIQ